MSDRRRAVLCSTPQLLLAATTILFNTYPSFQAAVCCGVLFACYVAQTKFNPFIRQKPLRETLMELDELDKKLTALDPTRAQIVTRGRWPRRWATHPRRACRHGPDPGSPWVGWNLAKPPLVPIRGVGGGSSAPRSGPSPPVGTKER